jgi:ribosomal protein S18 acetylase RimI-like enzyme
MTFRALAAEAEPERDVPLALPWVHAASEPYVDWLFRGHDAAAEALEKWMGRPSSEVFVGRAVLLLEESRPVGGFIALNATELALCRRHDAVAALASTPPDARSSLLSRLHLGRELLPDPPSDALYLSRIGVLPHVRRRGYGRAILREHLRRGVGKGFCRFSIDVWSANTAAIALYTSAGFRLERRHHVEAAGMTYQRMALEAT